MKQKDFHWVCNECGSQEFTSALSIDDIDEYLACSSCGCNEFHKECFEIYNDELLQVHLMS